MKMNSLYQILTASEADALWNFSGSTVRRAAWEGRIPHRKSAGTILVTLADMKEAYGLMPNATDFIADNLTDEDIRQWHDGEMTDNVQALMDAVGVDCIQVWGSHDGLEPVSVNLC